MKSITAALCTIVRAITVWTLIGLGLPPIPHAEAQILVSYRPVPTDLDNVLLYGGLYLGFDQDIFVYKVPGSTGAVTTYANEAAMEAALGFTATSAANRSWYDSTGILRYTTANQLRPALYDWSGTAATISTDPSGGTLPAGGQPAAPIVTQGILSGLGMEPIITQWITNWNLYTGGDWTKTGSTVAGSQNRPAPDGTNNGSTIREDSSNGLHDISKSITPTAAGQIFTGSCFIQAETVLTSGTREVALTISDGTNTVSEVVPWDHSDEPIQVPSTSTFPAVTLWPMVQAGKTPTGATIPWYRLQMTVTAPTTNPLTIRCGLAVKGNPSYQGTGNGSMGVFGVNLVQGTVTGQEMGVTPFRFINASGVIAQDTLKFNLPAAMQGLGAYTMGLSVKLADAQTGLSNVLVALEDSTNTTNEYVLQAQPNVNGVIGQHISGTGSSSAANNTQGPANPAGVIANIEAIFKGTLYWIDTSLGAGPGRAATTAVVPGTMSVVQVNGASSGATLSGNVVYHHIAIITGVPARTQLQQVLFPFPAYNPDLITPPNYFNSTFNALITPSGMEVFRSTSMPAQEGTSSALWPFFPATEAYNGGLVAASQSNSTTVGFQHELWQNRNNFFGVILWTDNSGTVYVRPRGPTAGDEHYVTTNGTASGGPGAGMKPYIGSAYTVDQKLSLLYRAAVTGAGYSPGDNVNKYVIAFTAGGGGSNTFWVNGTTGAPISPPPLGDLIANTDSPPNGKPNENCNENIQYGVGKIGTMGYTTLAKANAATLACALFETGYPQFPSGPCGSAVLDGVTITQRYCGWQTPLDEAGITNIIEYSDAVAHPTTYFTAPDSVVSTDVDCINCWIKPGALIIGQSYRLWGIHLDSEMSDGRLASSALDTVEQLTLIVHRATTPNIKIGFFVDTYLGAGQAAGYCGIGATGNNCDVTNLPRIERIVDSLSFPTGSPPPKGYTYAGSLDAQLAYLGPSVDWTHFSFQFNLGPPYPGGTLLSDAITARSFILAHNPGAVILAPVNTGAGGIQCRYTNLKIALVLGFSTGSCNLADHPTAP